MKKRICTVLLAVLLLMGVMVISVNAQQDDYSAYCEHCQMNTTWTPLTSSSQSMAAGGHFYVPENRVMTLQSIKSGKTVCIDLNGRTYTANKPLTVAKGGTLYIQGEGKFIGRGNKTIEQGGAINVQAGGKLLMHNVTVDYEIHDTRDTKKGGIIAVAGEATLNNCTVTGGRATVLGGNLYVASTGVLNLNNTSVSGGQILEDTNHSARCVYSEGQVHLAGNSSVELLRIGGTGLSNALNVAGEYSGVLNLHFDNLPAYGTDIGNLSGDADIRKSNICVINGEVEVYASGTDLIVDTPPAAQVNGVRYAEMADALAAAGEYPLELCKSVDSLTISKDLTLDLAGCSVGTLTAADGVTVSVIDIKTADYNIADGVYGTVGKAIGNVVAGSDAENSYLPIEVTSGTSYHALRMAISALGLRTEEAAVYYQSDFLGDSMVKELVASFGVALSVEGVPGEENVKALKNCTVFTQEQFNAGADVTSTLVNGILKDTNSLRINNRNAEMDIYGVPYLRFKDGTLLMGEVMSSSLRQIISTVEEIWEDLESEQQQDVMDMFLEFNEVMGSWELPVIQPAVAEREEKTIRILSIGNSHGNDSNWLLREVFLKQDPDRRVVVGVLYYSGCSIEQHVRYAQNNSPEYVYYKNVDGAWESTENATMLHGLQDERWDIVMIQEVCYDMGWEPTFQNDNLQTLIDYVKANTSGDPILGFNPEFTSPMTPAYYDPETAQTSVPDNWVQKHTDRYNMDQMYMYDCMISNLQKYVLTNQDIDPHYVLPAVTAIQYARNVLGMTDLDLYRDYAHISEMARLMVGYLWYCQLTGERLDSIDDMLVDEIPQHLRHRRYTSEGAMPVTEDMEKIILESVNYALENPYTVPDPTQQEDPGADDVMNVLMIGNSFSNAYTDELKAMADAAGKKLDIYNVYYGGCKLSQHYKFLKNDMPEYGYVKKNGVKIKENVTLWYCISLQNWDYISLQEGSSVLRDAASAQAGMDSNLKYFSHMYEWLKQRCPKSQIIWHQTWAYQVGTTSGGYVTKDAAQQAAYHERLYTYAEMITERYPDLLLVNSGDAWAIIRDGGYDNLCARLGSKWSDTAPANSGDNYHDGDIGGGQYLNACVWYEVLFGESCVGNTFQPNYDILIDVATLQQAAHQAVTTRNAN